MVIRFKKLIPASLILIGFHTSISLAGSCPMNTDQALSQLFQKEDKPYTEHKIQLQKLVSKEDQKNYYLIDTNGNAAANRLACDVYTNWSAIITINPELPQGLGGAFQGVHTNQLNGQLHVRAMNKDLDVIYHELLHAYLSSLSAKGVDHPFSGFYFRDRSIEPHEYEYANRLSLQELATFTFQALQFKEKAFQSLGELVNIARVVKDFKIADTTLLTKNYQGAELVGVKLLFGDFYIPKAELEKQNITNDKAYDYIAKKTQATVQLATKIYSIIEPHIEKTGFEYRYIALKENLSQEQKEKLIQQIRDALLTSELNDFINWTNTVWQQFSKNKL